MHSLPRFHWSWLGFATLALFLLFFTLYTPAASKGGSDYPALDPTLPATGIVDVATTQGGNTNEIITLANGNTLVVGNNLIAQFLPDGTPNLNFGDNGMVTLVYQSIFPVTPSSVVEDSQGRLLITGYFYAARASSGPYTGLLIRLLADGTPDATFGTNGMLEIPATDAPNGTPIRIVRQPDGLYLVLINSSFAGDSGLYRFDEDGMVDTTFGGDGSINVPRESRDVAVYPDGVLVTGRITEGGTAYGIVQRYRFSDGVLDTTFADAGTRRIDFEGITTPALSTIKITDDNTIVVAGSAPTPHTFLAARLTAGGAFDSTFNTDGKVLVPLPASIGPDTAANDFIITETGILLVGGSYLEAALLVKLTLDGDLDLTFAENGFFFNYIYGFRYGIAVSRAADGDYLIGGTHFTPALLKLDATGTPDSNYGDHGYYAIASIGDVSTQRLLKLSDSKLLVVGTIFGIEDDNGTVVLRTQPNGDVDTGYGINGIQLVPTPVGSYGTIFNSGSTVDATNRLIMAGYYESGIEDPQAVLTRLTSNGTLDTTFGSNGFLPIGTPGQEQAHAVTLDGSGNYVVAGQNFVAPSALIVRRFLSDGTPDITFGINGATPISACPMVTSVNFFITNTRIVSLANGDLMVAAYCNRPDPEDGFYLFRLTPDGDVDSTYGTDGEVRLRHRSYSMVITPDGTMTNVGTRYDEPTDTTYLQVEQYTEAGVPNSDFGTNGLAEYPAPLAPDTNLSLPFLAAQTDGKWVIGGNNGGGTDAPRTILMARLLPDGNIDTTFGNTGFSTITASRYSTVLDSLVSEGSAFLAGNYQVDDSNSGTVGIAKVILDEPVSPTPTATATPTQPQARTLYLPLVQRENP